VTEPRTEGPQRPLGSLGRYRLEEVLGEGAIGVVYRAVREPDGKTIALKILKRDLSSDETYRRRFAREARAAAEVRDKHLVPILDAGEADGRYYLASAYVPGSLADRLESEAALSFRDVVRIAAGVAGGLDALHRVGLVHRDVKPSNIMLDATGSAALTDFGLAKGPAYTVLTKPGEVIGTVDYLAPELIKGGRATPASDIYALGCTVYECIAGAPPFADKSLFELTAAHLEEAPPDLRGRRADLPEQLAWAVMHALAKQPDGRPPTATAYAHMLRLAARS
jgi:serine/threonine protein kinase